MVELAVTDWIGRDETRQTRLGAEMAAMLSATLDPETRVFTDGETLPQLWHWAAFPPLALTAQLGPDGHPERGGFLPPVELPRRMWAGGELRFLRPVRVGERLTRHSVIRDVSEKDGAAGPMVFVTVLHEIAGEDGIAIRERQDIVYLPMPERFVPPKPRPVPDAPAVERTVAMSAALLFRYSACTFNAHRIHYDLPYAREVEKYPGLVVHGPLQATLLMQLATDHRGAPPARFTFRGVHPMFHDHDLRLIGVEKEDGALALCTAKGDAHQGMQATAYWEETT